MTQLTLYGFRRLRLSRFGQFISCLSLIHLSGCSWPLGSTPQSGDSDLINLLMSDSKSRSSRVSVQLPQRTPRIKQTSSDPRLATASSSFQGSNVVERCLRAKGMPPETVESADPSNYDQRSRFDANGQAVESSPRLIVLHETVASEAQTLQLFRTPHPDESAQASYHVLIPLDGKRFRIVDDLYRAFGAGNSAFGAYTIQLKPNSPGSINNVALHLSLVTPVDGRNEASTHSGYSAEQYYSAAAQILLWQSTYGIPLSQLTTHKAVDRSQTRTDPRSFDWRQFLSVHSQLAQACGLKAFAAQSSAVRVQGS